VSERERTPGPEPVGLTKLIDELHRFRGSFDREPEGVCWLRVFGRGGESPVVVLAELDANASTSVTNLAEILAAEVIARHMPHRFEYDEPAVVLEHYPERRHQKSGKVVHAATWDRVTFETWAPRRIFLGGQERVSLGAPAWRRLPGDEVARLIGGDEAARRPRREDGS
jgi:hypothetical protein